MQIFRPCRKCVQSFKKICFNNIYEEARIRNPLSIYTIEAKNDKVHNVEKKSKKD